MTEFFAELSPMWQSLIATIFTWGITALGASIVFFFKSVNKSILDAMLGFAAGVMIAASFWSLLSPAIEMAEELNMISWIVVSLGFCAGGLLLFCGDKLYDFYEKRHPQKSGINKIQSIKRCFMLVFSITLHNIPEGISISVPIYYATNSKLKAIIYTALSGLSELFGAIITYLFLKPLINDTIMGLLFAIIAGIMLHIAIYELLPTASKYNYRKLMIILFSFGILFMLTNHFIFN